MDLYEAIETVDEWVKKTENDLDFYWQVIDGNVMDAIKICLEAARDKAGV